MTVAVITLILVLGTGFWYLNSENKQEKDKKAFASAVAKSSDLKKRGDNNATLHVWQDFIATKPQDNELRAQGEYYLASAWYVLSDYSNARKFGEAAVGHTRAPTYNMYVFLGDVTKVQKDYEAAANYYQKAYDMVQPSLAENPRLGIIASYLKSNVQLMKENLKQKQGGNGG